MNSIWLALFSSVINKEMVKFLAEIIFIIIIPVVGIFLTIPYTGVYCLPLMMAYLLLFLYYVCKKI